MTDDLIQRLRGIYIVPVNDGAGPLNGSMTHTRKFEPTRINLEAADEIERLQAALGQSIATVSRLLLSDALSDVLKARIEGAPVGRVVGGRANSFGGFHVEVAADAGWFAGQRVALLELVLVDDDADTAIDAAMRAKG